MLIVWATHSLYILVGSVLLNMLDDNMQWHVLCLYFSDVGERVGVTSSVPDFAACENDVSAAAAAATPLAAAAVSVISDLDDSLQHSCTLPPVDDEMQSIDTTGEF